jgi:hypothetical protein
VSQRVRANEERADTHNVRDTIECREHHGLLVGDFLLELDNCGVDLVEEPTGNDGEPALSLSELRMRKSLKTK